MARAARTRRCSSGCAPIRGSGCGDCRSCANACRAARAATRSSASTSRSTRAIACARCARRPGIEYDRNERGILQIYTDAQRIRARGRRRGDDARLGIDRASPVGRPLRRDRAGARAMPRAPCRRHLHGVRRIGRRASVHAGAGAHAPPGAASCSATASRSMRWHAKATRSRASAAATAPDARNRRRRRLRRWRSAATARCCCARSAFRAPVYPVKGYSATIDVGAHRGAPTVSLTDIAREDRDDPARRPAARRRHRGTVRLQHRSQRRALRGARETHVRALPRRRRDARRSTFWAGLRPATPSNVPCIGRTRYRNLYLDTGHGTLGWTMACGSGRALADVVAGRKPEVDFEFARS